MNRTIYSIRRHEKKEGQKLSKQGEEDAVKIGQSIEGDLLRVYHSPIDRAKKTAELIVEGHFGKTMPNIIYPSELLKMLDPKMPEGIKDEVEIINYWLKNDYILDGKFGETQFGQMYTAGRNIITHLIDQITESRNFNPQDGVVENITHAPNIESALITLVDPRIRSLDDIGGRFKPGENFELAVDYKENGIAAVQLNYKGTSKQLKTEDFR